MLKKNIYIFFSFLQNPFEILIFFTNYCFLWYFCGHSIRGGRAYAEKADNVIWGGLGKCWRPLTKGGGGVRQMLTLADKWGRGGLDPPIFGWHNLWTAPNQLFTCVQYEKTFHCVSSTIIPYSTCSQLSRLLLAGSWHRQLVDSPWWQRVLGVMLENYLLLLLLLVRPYLQFWGSSLYVNMCETQFPDLILASLAAQS